MILDANQFSFKNTFELEGASNASASPMARAETEAYRMGISIEDYILLEKEKKPIYGYLQFRKGVNDNQTGYLKTAYGDDIWVFKTEDVIDNSTFTVGDSMNYKGSGSLMSAPGEQNLNTSEDPHRYFLPFSKNKDVSQTIIFRKLRIQDRKIKPYKRGRTQQNQITIGVVHGEMQTKMKSIIM